jgi:transcriptional regulator with GAF, ATPase, and Fis domain
MTEPLPELADLSQYDTVPDDSPSSAIHSPRKSPPTLTQVFPLEAQDYTRVLSHDAVTLGRCPSDDGITLRDDRVSRNHAKIVWDRVSSSYLITDLASTNGTYVNGAAISTVTLRNGDVIRIGSGLFVFQDYDVMKHNLTLATTTAKSSASVLILGETGVGKEVMARRIHEWSGRSGPFVAVNCAALPKDLAAAELFGHVRGAFSSAHASRVGIIASADRGTLLLDEVGELPLELQALLLRVLEERTVRPVGGDSERAVDLRLISATNAPLEAWAREGRFRSDLLARLQQVTLRIAPLRERKIETLKLAADFSTKLGRSWQLSVHAAEQLLLHAWPQNVRELRNFVTRVLVVSKPNTPLSASLLSKQLGPTDPHGNTARNFVETNSTSSATSVTVAPPATDLPKASGPVMNAKERKHHLTDKARLEAKLREVGGNVALLARDLQTSRAHVYRWLRRLGIDTQAIREP